ncbi:MAG: hypothetical protein WC209_18495 [Ignavibacteriaceae bacterium]|jgi:hypothetical protein
MAYCPNCKTEFETSDKNCNECGGELIASPEVELSWNEDDFTLLTLCTQMYEAEIIKANLESSDIDAFILSQQDSNYPFLGNASAIKIFVRKEDEVSAREYLENINQQTHSTDED